MPQTNTINPPNAPMVDSKGRITREWYRFLVGLFRNSNDAVAGEVATPSGSGLEGGGIVANGVTLGIAPHGVTNAMFRESLGTSVVGRGDDSTGDVGDIRAVGNNTALTREGDLLAFRPHPVLQGLTVTTLKVDQTAAGSAATVTHSIPIQTTGGTMYILLSSTP